MKADFNVCVYCGSSSGKNPQHKEAAAFIGAELAKNGMTIVYGGGRRGLMGTLADNALANNGKVIGIIPDYMMTIEAKHEGVSELIIVSDIRTRKKLMEEKADAFLVLSGGLGTLDEMFEIMVLKRLKQLNQPIIILNSCGYWDKISELLEGMNKEGFLYPEDEASFQIAHSEQEVIEILQEAVRSNIAKNEFILRKKTC